MQTVQAPVIEQERTTPAPRMIDTPHHIVQPSTGLLQQTITIALHVNGLIARADAHEAVQAGMDVILYDSFGFALPDKGRVAQADENGIVVDLPDHADTPMRGAVITAQMETARRLPHAARHGNTVWKAMPHGDGSVTIARIDLPDDYVRGDALFHIDGMRADEYAVLNPADGLREGDILTDISLADFDAPVLDETVQSQRRIEELRMAAMLYALETAPVQIRNADGTFTCSAPTPLIETP